MKKIIMFFVISILAVFSCLNAQVIRHTEETGTEIKRVENEVWYIHNFQTDEKKCDSLDNCVLHRSFTATVESFTLENSNWPLNWNQMNTLYKDGYLEDFEMVLKTREFNNFGFIAKKTETKRDLILDKEKKQIYGKDHTAVKNVFAAENFILLLSIVFFSCWSILAVRKNYIYEAFDTQDLLMSFLLGLMTLIFLATATFQAEPFYRYLTTTWLLYIACALFFILAIVIKDGEFFETRMSVIFYPTIGLLYMAMYNIYTQFSLWQVSAAAVGLGIVLQWLLVRRLNSLESKKVTKV